MLWKMCVPLFHVENIFQVHFWKDLPLEKYVLVSPEYGGLACPFPVILRSKKKKKNHGIKQFRRGGWVPEHIDLTPVVWQSQYPRLEFHNVQSAERKVQTKSQKLQEWEEKGVVLLPQSTLYPVLMSDVHDADTGRLKVHRMRCQSAPRPSMDC